MFNNKCFDPMFERNDYICLDGAWNFAVTEGTELDFPTFDRVINLPYCPESELSGIGETDFMEHVWYKRIVELEPCDGKRTILKIGACDYETTVFVNGEKIGKHVGGYSSFSFDVTDHIVHGKNEIVISAYDDCKAWVQPSGKQSTKRESFGCYYTRTTGIWQSVCIELVPERYIKNFRIVSDINASKAYISGVTEGSGHIIARAFYDGELVGEASSESYGAFELCISLSELHLWELGDGKLYDLELEFEEDSVKSYFGMREVKLENGRFHLNGRPVFQRLVLDQGFYPDGIYTAPSEEAMIRDIELSMAAGFNGARLHQKVFEPRFLYHCDRLGYMVWGEHANWGYNVMNTSIMHNFISEWEEIIERDFNHPAIIGWCPFNETWTNDKPSAENDMTLSTVYKLTKRLDPTRPCIDTSGWYHSHDTDVFDIHDYCHDIEIMKKRYPRDGKDWLKAEPAAFRFDLQSYNGTPNFFVSEYGGIGLSLGDGAWGYNTAMQKGEDLIRLYDELTSVLLDCPKLFGFCYTQLYDVEQEQNGIYDYYRRPKVDIAKIKAINERIAASEKE